MLRYIRSVSCRWRGDAWRVEVHVEPGRDAAGVKQYLESLKGVVQGTTQSNLKPVAGLGAEAWWGPISPTNGILHVVKGTDVVWVQSYGTDAPGAGSLEKTRALMQRVLASYPKLPKS